MENFKIDPIDPLITQNKDDYDFFHADQKMHDLLLNGDIEKYLEYINNKNNKNSIIEVPVPKPNIKQVVNNINKKKMINSIWSNIIILEETIKKFKF
jgi:hypothetical protein